MSLKVLTPSQIEEFVELGYTILPEAFSRPLAEQIHKAVLDKIPAREDDPKTWTKAREHIADSFSGEPFMSACTPRFYAALDDLMGEDRYLPLRNLGWWPVLFPGFDASPWRVHEEEWHIDGGFFHHHLDSPEQGMLPIFVFSDIGPGDGGTGIAPGSHKVAARVLRHAQPAGLTQAELGRLVKEFPRKVVEVQANAGDVAMLHPFMLHTVSTNTGNKVRVICNPHVNFKDRMRVNDGLREGLSVVERSIVQAIAVPPIEAKA